jgi:hypothetical protein
MIHNSELNGNKHSPNLICSLTFSGCDFNSSFLFPRNLIFLHLEGFITFLITVIWLIKMADFTLIIGN